MKDGVIPVLVVAVLLAFADDVALYEDGTFVPRLDVPTMERLVRNPVLFSVRSYRIEGARKALVEQLAKDLRASSRVPRNSRVSSVLTAVGPLISRVRSLPESTRKTRRLGEVTLNVRAALLNATEPDRLLFEALPQALGFPPVDAVSVGRAGNTYRQIVTGTISALDELEAAYAGMLGEFVDVISHDLGVSRAALRSELQQRFGRLRTSVSDRTLIPIVSAMTDGHLSDDEWPGYLAMIVHGRTAEVWTDADLAAAKVRLAELLASVRRLESFPDTVPDDKRVIRVSVTAPNGADEHRVIWLERQQQADLDALTEDVVRQARGLLGQSGAESLLAALTLAVLGVPDTDDRVAVDAANGEEVQ
jgi:hypothetical protein